MQRIVLVGLDPVTVRPLQFTRRSDHTIDTMTSQEPEQPESRRTSLIGRLPWLRQRLDPRRDLRRVRTQTAVTNLTGLIINCAPDNGACTSRPTLVRFLFTGASHICGSTARPSSCPRPTFYASEAPISTLIPTCSMSTGVVVCSHDLQVSARSLEPYLSLRAGLTLRRLAFWSALSGGSGSREVCIAQSWYALLPNHRVHIERGGER